MEFVVYPKVLSQLIFFKSCDKEDFITPRTHRIDSGQRHSNTTRQCCQQQFVNKQFVNKHNNVCLQIPSCQTDLDEIIRFSFQGYESYMKQL